MSNHTKSLLHVALFLLTFYFTCAWLIPTYLYLGFIEIWTLFSHPLITTFSNLSLLFVPIVTYLIATVLILLYTTIQQPYNEKRFKNIAFCLSNAVMISPGIQAVTWLVTKGLACIPTLVMVMVAIFGIMVMTFPLSILIGKLLLVIYHLTITCIIGAMCIDLFFICIALMVGSTANIVK